MLTRPFRVLFRHRNSYGSSFLPSCLSMAEQGKDGQFRMVIESKYKKLAKTRTEAKIFAVLSVGQVLHATYYCWQHMH